MGKPEPQYVGNVNFAAIGKYGLAGPKRIYNTKLPYDPALLLQKSWKSEQEIWQYSFTVARTEEHQRIH